MIIFFGSLVAISLCVESIVRSVVNGAGATVGFGYGGGSWLGLACENGSFIGATRTTSPGFKEFVTRSRVRLLEASAADLSAGQHDPAHRSLR